MRIVAPMMAIETVAAGGGSICRFDGVKLVVGPESAGADPGPACYGRGGPLTVTDVQFLPGPDRGRAVSVSARSRGGGATASAASVARREAGQSVGGGTIAIAGRAGRGLSADRQREHGRGDSAASRSPRARTRPTTCSWPSAGPRRSMPAPSRASWAFGRCSCIPTPACSSALGIGLADVTRHRSCGIERPLDRSSRWRLPGSNSTSWNAKHGPKFAGEGVARSKSPRRARSTCAIRASTAT